MSVEQVALIQCAECGEFWLRVDDERWLAHLDTDSELVSTARSALSASSARLRNLRRVGAVLRVASLAFDSHFGGLGRLRQGGGSGSLTRAADRRRRRTRKKLSERRSLRRLCVAAPPTRS